MYLKDVDEEVVMQSRDPVFYNYTISPFDINRYWKDEILAVKSKRILNNKER